MTVKELIKELSQWHPDMDVVLMDVMAHPQTPIVTELNHDLFREYRQGNTLLLTWQFPPIETK